MEREGNPIAVRPYDAVVESNHEGVATPVMMAADRSGPAMLRGRMPVYAIPSVYVPGFKRLADLSTKDVRGLKEAFAGTPPVVDLTVMAERVASASGLPVDLVNELTGSIFSLAVLRSRNGLSAAETADSILLTELSLPAERVAGFRSVLADLIDLAPVRLTVRAIDLAAADERLLISSRVITDLRPVFPEPWDAVSSDALEPVATLIVHTLRLEYLEGDVNRTFQLALDGDDIRTLRSNLERAERKVAALTGFIAKAGLSEIPVKKPSESR
jgi:hypothetical protein